jgi:hypothetical protein
MANPQIQIGNLEFDDIKDSIKQYLQTQDVFSDYNFEGSAASTLLDILAYNTTYYAFYSNMIANEMFFDTAQKLSSLISLAKPLGYTVPGAKSAKSTVLLRAGGIGQTLNRYHRFTGRDETGGSFTFYTFQPYVTDENGDALIEVHQGSRLFDKISAVLNLDRTKTFISTVNIDINSLVVEVQTPDDTDFIEWISSGSINQNVDENSRIYFLERTDAGFFVVFGGNYATDVDRQAGLALPEGTRVRLSYVTSSGEVGNGVGNFISDFSATTLNNNTIVETKSLSENGATDPNIESIKFFAPKFFAAQDRAVTKQDAIAIIGNSPVGEGVENSDYKFTVWGGEEQDPPYYGRVFVSLINSDENSDAIEPDITDVQTALSNLRERLTISILPEYIGPVSSILRIGMTVTFDENKTNLNEEQLKSEISTYLNNTYQTTQRAFNKSLDLSQLVTGVSSVDSSLNVDPSEISTTLEVKQKVTNNGRQILIKNPILQSTAFSVSSTPTQSNLGENIQIRNSVNPSDYNSDTGYGQLDAYTENNNSLVLVKSNVGKVNYERGIIIIDQGVLTGEFTLSVKPKKISFEAKQELLSNFEFVVNVQKELPN